MSSSPGNPLELMLNSHFDHHSAHCSVGFSSIRHYLVQKCHKNSHLSFHLSIYTDKLNCNQNFAQCHQARTTTSFYSVSIVLIPEWNSVVFCVPAFPVVPQLFSSCYVFCFPAGTNQGCVNKDKRQ